jgi:phenylacetate-CoA ligase
VSGIIDKIYLSSPIWLQQLAIGVWGLGWYHRRYNKFFHQAVRELRSRDFWAAEQFRAYQSARLVEVLRAAWNSPYYRDVFESSGVTRSTDPWEAMQRLPVLAKETFRARGKELLTTEKLPGGTRIFNTSGATGTPSAVYFTREFHALQMAVCEARNVNIGGACYRDRRFMCGGRKVCAYEQTRPPFWRFSPVENLAYASVYHLSPAFLPAYLDFLCEFRPTVVMGYPSALAVIARFALENHRSLPSAKMVVTLAETLLAQDREAIEKAWRCQVFDRYGSIEACLFAGQCEQGRYHVSPDIGILELVDQNGNPVPAGEIGVVVATGLQNTLQPLIRYRLGDAARSAVDQHCGCGRNTPILECIEGRLDDILYTDDGRQIGRVDHIFKGNIKVREAQVIQTGIATFIINVVPADGFSEQDVGSIIEGMRLHVGNAEVRVEPVAQIERAASGKFRAVLCKLSPAERAAIQAKVAMVKAEDGAVGLAK